jgi:hypothetical protein
MNTSKVLSIAALAVAGIAGTGAAQAAHPDVQWSVRIGVPIPVPVLPIPLPRFESVPVYTQPAWRDRDRDGIPDWRDHRDNRRGGPAWRVDRDRDGIPDRYDRHDNRYDPRYDQWHDHRYDNRQGWHDPRAVPPAWRQGEDRDRDGRPDWHDPRNDRGHRPQGR